MFNYFFSIPTNNFWIRWLLGLDAVLFIIYLSFQLKFSGQDDKIYSFNSSNGENINLYKIEPQIILPTTSSNTETRTSLKTENLPNEVDKTSQKIIEKPVESISNQAENSSNTSSNLSGDTSQNAGSNSNTNDDNQLYSGLSATEYPIYPGCEAFKGNKQLLYECMSKRLGQEIMMVMQAPKSNDKEIQRVIIEFIVEKDGSVSEVVVAQGNAALAKSAKEAMIKVAERINKYRKIVPAKNANGQAVRLKFQLPIKFKPSDV